MNTDQLRRELGRGLVIPAHPLALNSAGRFDERHQRVLTRYYAAAGAGGLAVGVHTTQFAIRDPRIGLFEPVLALAREEMDRADRGREVPLVRIGGICGATTQALTEAAAVADHGYHAGLLSLAALSQATDTELIAHCGRVAERLPLVGFYLQPLVGGRPLGYSFWRRFVEIPQVVAIKIAPFNRYQTLDVVRALADSGRDDVALYTGNDDTIVNDLITPFRRPARPLGRVDQRCGATARRLSRGRCERTGVGRAPPDCCGSDRYERRIFRRGKWICRLHRRDQRSASATGTVDERPLSRSARYAQSASGGSHRSRLPGVS
jgi:hypothetical protein